MQVKCKTVKIYSFQVCIFSLESVALFPNVVLLMPVSSPAESHGDEATKKHRRHLPKFQCAKRTGGHPSPKTERRGV